MLNRKLFRDLLEHKGANLATIVVIAIGILLFNGSAKVMDDLIYSKKVFYEQCIFPDAYAKVIAAPINFKKSYQKIDGVKLLEGRMSSDVELLNTNKTLRLISKTKNLGKYVILEGKEPRDNVNEILIGNNFASANNYKIGDTLDIVASGKQRQLSICGIARSAENIFVMKDADTLFSDPKEFGIAFVDLKLMQEITGKNSFDEILFLLDNDSKFEIVKNAIDKQMENYGIISIYERADQTSEMTVEGEIKELKTTMIFMPSIFLIVAALVMSIMIKRIISQQRGQIGILKAFGYGDVAVAWHYASYCVVLGLIGGIIGAFGGMLMAGVFTDMYKELFNMRFLSRYSFYNYLAKGTMLAVVFCVFTGLRASTKALVIKPAEAMRPEAPSSGKKSFIEGFSLFALIFDSRGKMAVRNIIRNRKRSFFVILGLSLAFAISVMPWSMVYMMDALLIDRYKDVEVYDAKIALAGLQASEAVVDEMENFNGVDYAQAQLNIPAKLKNRGIVEDVLIIGLPQSNKLYKIIDANHRAIEMTSSGIVLSERLAEKLELKLGDELIFKSPYSKYKSDEITLKISNIVEQGIGMNGYMDISYLSQVLGYKEICNMILVATENENIIDNIDNRYQDSEKINSIHSKKDIINQTMERMSSGYSSMYFMAIIAMLMSFAIVYNIYLVVILERKREFSTMMVLGMKEKEVLSIVALEQWLSAIMGIIVGIPISKLMVISLSEGLSSDMFTLPQNLEPKALLLATIMMIVSIFMAQLLAAKQINKIDIVEALKAAE